MAITGLTVEVDRTNYCTYNADFPVVTIAGVATGGGPSDTVTLTLSRQILSGPYQLWTAAIHPTAASGAFAASVDLRTLVDANGIMTATLSKEVNDYTLMASAPTVQASTNFTVLPFSVDQVRERWCVGLPLITYERLQVRNQPQQVTGVTLLNPAFGSVRGTYQLSYVVTPTPALSWGNGAFISVPSSGTYFLPDLAGINSIQANVVFASLPTSAASEPIVLDYGQITDDAMVRTILGMTNTVREFLNIFFEPTLIVTQEMLQLEPQAVPAWEVVGLALNFYKPDNWLKWLEFSIPYRPLLQFNKLSGYFNKTKAIDIDVPHLITFDERSAQVSFVPSNLAVVNSFFVGPGVYIMFFNQLYVPQFWNYYILVGYRQMPSAIMEYIAKRVAIDLLLLAGQARYPAGMAGASTSRDGISESNSLIPGIYKTQIDQYEYDLGRTPDGRDNTLISLRNRFRGLAFTTL